MSFVQECFARAGRSVRGASASTTIRLGAGTSPGEIQKLYEQNRIAQQNREQAKHYQGTTYAIITFVANRIASQEFRVARLLDESHNIADARLSAPALFRKTAPASFKSMASRVDMLTSHPLLSVMVRPNDIMVKHNLIFITVAGLQIFGRAFWWMLHDKFGRPQIWPIPASWMRAEHDGKPFSGWVMKPYGGDKEYHLTPEEVAYFYMPDPADPLGSISPIQAMSRQVMCAESVGEAQYRSFENGITPSLAIVMGDGEHQGQLGMAAARPTLTKEQREQLVLAVKSQWRGVINNGEPLILDGLINDIKQLHRSPQEMDYQNSSKSIRGELAQGFGVNPIVMGEIEGANRASSQFAENHVIANKLNPTIEMMSEVITAKVAPFFSAPDDHIIAYFQKATVTDAEHDMETWTRSMGFGCVSRDEYRAAIHGLGPIKDGNLVIINNAVYDVTPLAQRDEGARIGRSAPGVLGLRELHAAWLRLREAVASSLKAKLLSSLPSVWSSEVPAEEAVVGLCQDTLQSLAKSAALIQARMCGLAGEFQKDQVEIPKVGFDLSPLANLVGFVERSFPGKEHGETPIIGTEHAVREALGNSRIQNLLERFARVAAHQAIGVGQATALRQARKQGVSLKAFWDSQACDLHRSEAPVKGFSDEISVCDGCNCFLSLSLTHGGD